MSVRVGGYVLEERIARGGMAEVWRARDGDGNVVCIKRLDPSLRHDVDFIEMFRDEAALVLDLDHENIVRVHELVDTDEELAQVMELVDGPSLARIRAALGEDGLSVPEALQIGIYLCRALHHAHTRRRDGHPDGEPLQIVHRDVSPQNILIDKQGRVKLVDFGVAKAAQRLTRTRAGTLKGKLSYMAPEQARGDVVDHRADQFAAGILLWEMLTGRRLFGGRNELLILEQVTKSDPVPPSTVKKGIPRLVDKAVLRALRWHPEERFADIGSFGDALQFCLKELVPAGSVPLAGVVARTLAVASKVEAQGAARTRVMLSPKDGDTDVYADDTSVPSSDTAPVMTDPTAQPEHTGQFFERRLRLPRAALPIAAGVVVLLGGLAAAVFVAERPPEGDVDKTTPLFVDRDAARARLDDALAALDGCEDACARAKRPPPEKLGHYDAALLDGCLVRCKVKGAGAFRPPAQETLEALLHEAPAHPCRTELLDDLLDKSPLSQLGLSALADDAEQCVRLAAAARERRASVDLDPYDDGGKDKKKKKRPPPSAARLEQVGRLALDVGEYAQAKQLLAEAVAADPSRVRLHGMLGQAFRGLGDPAGAAHHYRLYFHAFPDDKQKERAERYLLRRGAPRARRAAARRRRARPRRSRAAARAGACVAAGGCARVGGARRRLARRRSQRRGPRAPAARHQEEAAEGRRSTDARTFEQARLVTLARRIWPHVIAVFLVVHVVANSLDVVPDLRLGLDKRAWTDPRARRELQMWADRFGVERQRLEDFAYDAGQTIQSVRNAVVAPFRPYLSFTGLRQSWAMFGAGTEISDRFGVRMRRCADCPWEELYVHADPASSWRKNVLAHPRVRSGIFRWGWPTGRASYKRGCEAIARLVVADFADAATVQCRFESATLPSPKKPGPHPASWGKVQTVEIAKLRSAQ
jgi:tetratricopeptide (TPR) repeat protein